MPPVKPYMHVPVISIKIECSIYDDMYNKLVGRKSTFVLGPTTGGIVVNQSHGDRYFAGGLVTSLYTRTISDFPQLKVGHTIRISLEHLPDNLGNIQFEHAYFKLVKKTVVYRKTHVNTWGWLFKMQQEEWENGE